MRYLHLDVFTERPFEGNQLAVFPEPRGLSTEMMQTITREMNFSECTFVFPAEAGGDVKVRIFTPGEELPMAGHPVIGTTFALAVEDVIASGRAELVYELGVGPTPVSLEWKGPDLSFAWMTQKLPQYGAIVRDRSSLAAALGIDERELGRAPAQVVSCGVPFLIVHIADRRVVDEVAIDRKALVRCLRDAGSNELPVFSFSVGSGSDAPHPKVGPARVYSRMLAPGFGIGEDPATGSASGPLGCYMLQHGLVSPGQARALVSHQGVAMKRPSELHISIDTDGGVITRVRVGGTAVLVGRGDITAWG